MLQSHELLGFMSPALANDILSFIFESDKPSYKAALAKLDRKGVARLRDEQRDFNATRNKSFGRPDYQLKREMERRLVVLRGMAARN